MFKREMLYLLYVREFIYDIIRKELKEQRCDECGALLDSETIPAPEYSRGDANMDGKVDYFDYIMVRRYCMKTYELSDEQLIYADADGSGNVDFFDYMMIRRHCMGTYVIK